MDLTDHARWTLEPHMGTAHVFTWVAGRMPAGMVSEVQRSDGASSLDRTPLNKFMLTMPKTRKKKTVIAAMVMSGGND